MLFVRYDRLCMHHPLHKYM